MFGLSREESFVLIGAGVAVLMAFIILFVVIVKKRYVRCRLAKGDKSASIELNQPSTADPKPADVSVNSATPMLCDESIISETSV